MKREVKNQLDAEKRQLFRDLYAVLLQEEKKLRETYDVSRNMACSEWKDTSIGLQPVKVLPDTMELLDKNFALHLEQISRRKYYLIKAFRPLGVILDELQFACYKHWQEELSRRKPNLTDRFKDVAD